MPLVPGPSPICPNPKSRTIDDAVEESVAVASGCIFLADVLVAMSSGGDTAASSSSSNTAAASGEKAEALKREVSPEMEIKEEVFEADYNVEA